MQNTPHRSNEIADFFAANQHRLLRALGSKVRARIEVLEDACAVAWTTLVRRPDIELDVRGFVWLLTVAEREAWRLSSLAREVPAGGLRGEWGESLPEPADTRAGHLDDRVVTRLDRVQAIRSLKPREREALYLFGLGYSYDEIAQITNATYTAVNRRITEGRAALRRRTAER